MSLPARIDTPEALAAGLGALLALDPRLGGLRARCAEVPTWNHEAGFPGLVWIVLSQQVSVRSAEAALARAKAAFVPLDPTTVLAASDETFRAAGLTRPKTRTLRAVAAAVRDGGLDLDGLAGLSPEAAHQALTAVHGIGPWTADTYAMVCLGQPDAFPVGDLALQEAARLAFGLDARPGPEALLALAEPWRPLRAVAARLLWAYYLAVKAEGAAAARSVLAL